MAWKYDIFRSGLHGGYLVDSGFFAVIWVMFMGENLSVLNFIGVTLSLSLSP